MKKKINFFTLSRLGIYLFFAFLPFQIKALVITDDIYSSGFFNPYLSHFIYITDVFFVISIVFLALGLLFNSEKIQPFKILGDRSRNFLLMTIIAFLIFHFISIFFSSEKINSFLYSIRILEFFIVSYLVFFRFIKLKILLYVFIGAINLVAGIGILQYLFQGSLGINILGEPLISSEKLGVAKILLNDGGSILRIYGTFSHPNVFGGWLVFAIFFSLYFLKNSRKIFFVSIMICGLALILTFSRSGILALIIGLFIYSLMNFKSFFRNFIKYFVFIFTLIVFFVWIFDLYPVLTERFLNGDENSMSERSLYFSASEKMLIENPFGVGTGNFTHEMQNYLDLKLMPWLIQPVHNIFLLEFNELGIQGGIMFFVLFIYIFYFLFKKGNEKNNLENKKFISILVALWSVIIIIGLFDHYFVSLYQGEALFWFSIGLLGFVE